MLYVNNLHSWNTPYELLYLHQLFPIYYCWCVRFSCTLCKKKRQAAMLIIVNDLIQRALSSADIPSRLKTTGLSHNDGKRSDGLTLMPWANGRCLLRDFTCRHTLAASSLNRAVLSPSNVAGDAEKRKICKHVFIYLYNKLIIIRN